MSSPKTKTPPKPTYPNLRASSWDEYIGQARIKKALTIALGAAKSRKEAAEHTLFYGPPGLGKTTLAHLIAGELGVNIRASSGPAIERAGDLASILTNLNDGDIFFIDEIHRLTKIVEETLYPAMEDYHLDIVVGQGPSARTLKLDLPKFTLIGATTRIGLIAAPLRDRFGIIHRLTFYQPEDLAKIINNAAKKLKITLDHKSSLSLAKRSRGTPRIALKLLRRARDMAQVKGESSISSETLNQSLDLLEVDKMGLDGNDIRYLKSLVIKHRGGPVGLETLSATIAEEKDTLEDVIEPYLLQLGFIKRSPRGRTATPKAFTHLKQPLPKNYQN